MPAKKATAKRTRKRTAKKKSAIRAGSTETPKRDLEEVEFFYLKSTDFRSIHIDGAIGGVTPRGVLHVAFFSERPAIPKRTVSAVTPTGTLGAEIRSKREGKQGIVRQMEIDVFMNESTVLDLRNWLTQKLEEFETRKALAASKTETSH